MPTIQDHALGPRSGQVFGQIFNASAGDGMLTLSIIRSVPHSRFVRLVLEEYGLPARLVEERAWERREEFLMLNPAGTTPVLVEEGGAAGSGGGDHRRISRRDPRHRAGRTAAVAAGRRRARRSAPADELVQRQILRRGSGPAGDGARLQALHPRRAMAAARPTPTRCVLRRATSDTIWPISAGWCARATGLPATA